MGRVGLSNGRGLVLAATVAAAGGWIGYTLIERSFQQPEYLVPISPDPVPEISHPTVTRLASVAATDVPTPDWLALRIPVADTATVLTDLQLIDPARSDAVGETLSVAAVSDDPLTIQPTEHDHDGHAMAETADASADIPCVKELAMIANRTRLYFGPNGTVLGPDGRLKALTFARWVAGCPQAKVTVVGFADPKGAADANIAVSWARAEGVISLLARNGLPTSQFTAKSHMEVHPDYCIHFDVVDRRVEFEVSALSE